MKNNTFSLFIATALVFVMSSCCCNNGKQNQDSCNVENKTEIQTTDKAFIMPFEELNGKWQVISIFGSEIKLSEGQETAYVQFDLGLNQINAYAGCNYLSATINRNARTANALAFDNSLCTEMYCDNIALEDSLKKALIETQSYENEGEIMYFMNENSEKILSLKR